MSAGPESLALVAAMAGLDPATVQPRARLPFSGVTATGLRRLREAGVEMAAPRSLLDLVGPRSLLAGRLSVDEHGRPGLLFDELSLQLDSREEALSLLAEIKRPLVSWAPAGRDGALITVRVGNEDLGSL